VKWLPWRYLVRRLVHVHGFHDPIEQSSADYQWGRLLDRIKEEWEIVKDMMHAAGSALAGNKDIKEKTDEQPLRPSRINRYQNELNFIFLYKPNKLINFTLALIPKLIRYLFNL
jgi:hypothetical protein